MGILRRNMECWHQPRNTDTPKQLWPSVRLRFGLRQINTANAPRTEIERHVVFHRQRAAGGVEYIIDTAYWIADPAKQIRTDVKGLPASWYIGVHAMKAAGKQS